MNKSIQSLINDLPSSLRDQVAGYVAAIAAAADSIFASAGIQRTAELDEKLLLIAALRKTLGIVASCFWSVDNSLGIARRDGMSAVRVGGAIYTRDSQPYLDLRRLHHDLEEAVLELGLSDAIHAVTYVDVLEELVNGHQ